MNTVTNKIVIGKKHSTKRSINACPCSTNDRNFPCGGCKQCDNEPNLFQRICGHNRVLNRCPVCTRRDYHGVIAQRGIRQRNSSPQDDYL